MFLILESLPHIVMHHSANIIVTTTKATTFSIPDEFNPRCLKVVSRVEIPHATAIKVVNTIAV